ncbi:Ubiquitin carboxyl-terminal hydrolase family protein [Hondaea fermentalgiana]|uniref:Ubiquitin carboxyl-terminal hydrolase family protein n=1 Tax=Hondaea fermentalgiana TaxID=2315210 RepID=A0A2R5GZZ9_9STRA|nr:Ubiquitin carboxyl-terminal hydrolase family protein [Hondaea fermentalgiana]|eukprot:GBG33634.1 Ubiquitin carboxyl-terminal hydrolase family protein [Hondaea fermentalgiana]
MFAGLGGAGSERPSGGGAAAGPRGGRGDADTTRIEDSVEDEEGPMETAILASLLPPPSKFALVHDLPEALRAAVAAQRRGQLGEETLSLVVEGFTTVKEFLLALSPADVSRDEHEDLLDAFVWLLQDLDVRSEVRDIISVDDLVHFLGIPTETELSAKLAHQRNAPSSSAGARPGRGGGGPTTGVEMIPADPTHAADTTQPIWVATQIFKAIRCLLSARPSAERDLALERIMKRFLRAIPLAALRELSVGHLDQFCRNLASLDSRNGLRQSAVLVFVKSPILQRRLDAIDLILDMETPPQWLTTHRILEVLLERSPVHAELCRRAEPIMRALARENLVSDEILGLAWNVSIDLLCVAVQEIPDMDLLKSVLVLVNDGGAPRMDRVARLVRTIAMRSDLDAALAQTCVVILWELRDATGVSNAVLSHFEQGDGLLELAVDMCMKSLDRDASFFSHRVLDLLWRQISPLGDVLRSDWSLEDRWFEAVDACLSPLDETAAEEPDLMNALDLGTQLLLHEQAAEAQAALVLRIWDLFATHLGDAPAVRARITADYFTWLSHLCETRILFPLAAHALFVDRVIPFVQSARPETTAFAFGPECFGLIRSIFIVDNQDRLVNLKDNANRTEIQPADDPASDEDPLAYVVLTCDPSDLEGVHLLWHVAVHTWSNAVSEHAVSALQALYDPSLDPESSRALRVRRDYVAKCSKILDELPADSTQAIQRGLGFVEALLNDADHHGTRGFRPHGARQRGQIHNLVLVAAENVDAPTQSITANTTSSSSSSYSTPFGNEDRIFEVTLYSNATIWDVRCAVASRLPTPVPANKIALSWPASGDDDPMGDEENATTLADLGFARSETLMFQHQDDEILLQRTPRVRLLDETSQELTPLARAAFGTIFDEWASDHERELLSLDDFSHLFMFCTGATNQSAIERRCASVLQDYASVVLESTETDLEDAGANETRVVQDLESSEPHLTRDDFLHFYRDAAQTRPMSVWKDLLKLGFDTKLQHTKAERGGTRLTSEFRLSWFEREPDANAGGLSVYESDKAAEVGAPGSPFLGGWRPILAHEATLYRVLFRLLKAPSNAVSRTAWSILLRLPTSKSVLAALKNVETAKLPSFFSVEAAGQRFVQYSLHVVVSFMEADESRQLIGASEGRRARADSVEQHFERARRASFEPKRPGRRRSGHGIDQDQLDDELDGTQWTHAFLRHGGLALLQALVQSALDEVSKPREIEHHDVSASVLDATPMGQVLELALKAIKLCLTCTKFSSASVLAGLGLAEQLELVERARCVMNQVIAGRIVSTLSAEYALFIWDFFFSWLHKQPADVVQARVGETACIELSVAAQRGRSSREAKDTVALKPGVSSEVVFSRHIWQDDLAAALVRVGSRFPTVRDRYLDQIATVEVEGEGLRGWVLALAGQLLSLEPVSRFMPSSPQFDMRLLNSLVKRILAGSLHLCRLLAVMVREDEQTIYSMASTEFSVQELVVQLSHRLTSAQGGEHRGAILQLLAALATSDTEVASLVCDTVLIPLLRSKDPTVTKRTNRRQSLDRRNHRVGLVNLHNTCYMNSLLQQLALMAPVRDLIFAASSDADENSWLGALQLAIAYLLRSERKAFSPVQLIQALNVNPREQQDCEEFMNRLLELLEEATANEDRWNAAFGGSMQVQRMCGACKAQQTVIEGVGTHIAIDVEGSHAVLESLERSTFCAESLEGFRCEHCGQEGQVVQRKVWERVPQALIFHLKRFRYDLGLGAKEKLTNSFCFEEELFGRELVGIICHQGAADGGHYYSYVRSRPEERAEAAWYELNDTNVRTLDGFPAEAYQSAYILCYVDKGMLDAPLPLLPRAIQTRIDRDNMSLESSCTVQHAEFWRLCDATLNKLLKSSSARSERSTSQHVLVKLSPLFSERSVPQGGRPMAETLALSLLRMISIESIFRIDGQVVASLHEAVLAMCRGRESFIVQIAQTLMTLSASFPMVPATFRFVDRFMELAKEDEEEEEEEEGGDALELVVSILLRSESFVEACVACYEKGDAEIRMSICRCLTYLICGAASDPSAPGYAGACEAFDWVFSNEPGFVREYLHTCEAQGMETEEFARLSRSLSSLSSTCARLTAEALLESLDRAEELYKPALRLILSLDDRRSRDRLDALIGPRGGMWSRHLHKVLAQLDTEVDQDIRIQCLGSPCGLLFCCTNARPTGVQIHIWFPDESSRQIYGLPENDTLIADEVSAGETRILYFAPRLPRLPGKAVSPSRSAMPRCAFEWEVQPLTALTATQAYPSRTGSEDRENSGVDGNADDKLLLTVDFAQQAQKLAAMGFHDMDAVLNALSVAKGNEQMAVEILLGAIAQDQM